MLFAPKSGKDLRKDIKKKTIGYYGGAKKFIGASKVKANDMLKSGLTIFSSAKNKTGKALSTGRELTDGETGKSINTVKSRARISKKNK